jgi:hypothetical protein
LIIVIIAQKGGIFNKYFENNHTMDTFALYNVS